MQLYFNTEIARQKQHFWTAQLFANIGPVTPTKLVCT